MNVATEDLDRFSARVICRSILNRKWLWPEDGGSEGFRQDLEQLLVGLNEMEPLVLKGYIWALLHVSSRMPQLRLNRGALAALVETLPTSQPAGDSRGL